MHADPVCCRFVAAAIRPCPAPNTPRPQAQSTEATLIHFPKTPQSVMVGKSTARIGRDFACSCQRVKTCHSLDFGKPCRHQRQSSDAGLSPQIKSSLHDYRKSAQGPQGCDLVEGIGNVDQQPASASGIVGLRGA